jgi:hypothetical protein
MPLQKLTFKPGVNRESTNYANEGGYYDCDHIRFRSGQPEKIGGWARYSNNQFVGVCRSLWNWVAINGTNYLGFGTSRKYYIESGTTFNDVTPYIYHSSPALNGPFTATTGSAVITIKDAQYVSASIGDYITITDAVGLGGNITATVLNKDYVVTRIIPTTSPPSYEVVAYSSQVNAGQFVIGQSYTIQYIGSTDFTLYGAATNTIGLTFTATGKGTGSGLVGIPVLANASDTGNGGAAVVIYYEYPIGNDYATTGVGWGTGPWSANTPVVLGANPFATTNNSGTITVTHTAHGLSTGNYVCFAGATTTAGILAGVLNTTFVITVVNANSYTILTPGNTTNNSNAGTILLANATTSGGGSNVSVFPQFGTRGWGTDFITGIRQQLRLWSNDNFGQNLLIAPRGGSISYWTASTGVSIHAVPLAEGAVAAVGAADAAFVPTTTNQVVAAPIQRFVIAMGSNPYDPTNSGTAFNPMIVRWSDQENPFQWVPDITNQAGEFPLSNGSFIMQALATRQEILIWTDSALYSMQYLGAPYVWGFNILADNISIISPKAAITVNNVTYWMGTEKFYIYNGRVDTLPCTLRQYVFNDININQGYQIFAGSNEGYNEVWWFYCSANSDSIDKYVIYNYLDNVWYYGTMGRTAWLDAGMRPYPIASNYDNRLLNHEIGVDDVSGESPLPIDAYVQSSDFDIGDGYNFGFVWRILPDVNFNGSTVNKPSVTMTVKPRQNSGTPYGQADNPAVVSADNYSNRQAYNIQEFTGQVYTRIRGRQMSFRIESDTVGVAWQLGAPRIDIRPDGKR